MLRRSLSALTAATGFTAADIEAKLRASKELAPVQNLTVQDTSSGCGSFFNISITSPAFAGKSLMQQHRMVNSVLKTEIAAIHGFSLNTHVGK